MQHLALLYQFANGFGHRLYRYGGVNAVLVVEVDAVGAQAAQRAFYGLTDGFWAARQRDRTGRRVKVGRFG